MSARPIVSLTKAEKETLDFLCAYRKEHGISPTLKEIGAHRGVTKPTVHGTVDRLIAKGYLRREGARLDRVLLPHEEHEARIAALEAEVERLHDIGVQAGRYLSEVVSLTPAPYMNGSGFPGFSGRGNGKSRDAAWWDGLRELRAALAPPSADK